MIERQWTGKERAPEKSGRRRKGDRKNGINSKEVEKVRETGVVTWLCVWSANSEIR